MMLKMRHLQVFNALLDAGSVSRAAQRLNLTQPAVSIALSNFEAELGFRLFHRERGFFAPTNEAILLHDEVAQGLRAISQIEKRVQDILLGQTGGVSIATNGVLAVNFLPKLLAPFQRENPNIRVEIKVQSSRQIASWVASHHIDIGLIDPPVPVAGLDAEIFDFECVCVIHKDDPLATLGIISPQSLVGRSVINITGDHMIDRQLDALLAKTDTVIVRNTSAYYFAIARNMVAERNGVAILDPINGKIDLRDDVVWRPFAPRIENNLAVITAKGQPLGQAAVEILDRIRAALRQFAN